LKRIILAGLVLGLLSLPGVSSAQADTYASVSLVSPQFGSTFGINSTFPITFDFSGGFASQTADCVSMTGIDISLSISDPTGKTSTLKVLSNPSANYPDTRAGLWSQQGWTSKVINGGIECSWIYQGNFVKDPLAGTATKISIEWSSPITGLSYGYGGQGQTVGNQSGSSSFELSKFQSPVVTLSGLTRGATINSPTKFTVSVTTNQNIPITTLGFTGGTWVLNSATNSWTEDMRFACVNIASLSQTDGNIKESAQCTFDPNDFTYSPSNYPFIAYAYSADHRFWISDPVYVNIQQYTPVPNTSQTPTPSPTASSDPCPINSDSSTLSSLEKQIPNLISKQQAISLLSEYAFYSKIIQSDLTQFSNNNFDASCASQVVAIQNSLQKTASSIKGDLTRISKFRDSGVLQRAALAKYQAKQAAQAKAKAAANAAAATQAKVDATFYFNRGYSAIINNSEYGLLQSNFYLYLNGANVMTPANGFARCQNYVQLVMRSTASSFDSMTGNDITAWINGCSKAAVIIKHR
jgi:hypothetical protein